MAVALAGHMQVCTSLQTDNHASTSPLSFLQAGCPSCRQTNSFKALKAKEKEENNNIKEKRRKAQAKRGRRKLGVVSGFE